MTVRTSGDMDNERVTATTTIEADPAVVAPFSSRPPYEREVAYAHRAAGTPHYILSTRLEGVDWPPTARIVRDLDALRVEGADGREHLRGRGTHVRRVTAHRRPAR